MTVTDLRSGLTSATARISGAFGETPGIRVSSGWITVGMFDRATPDPVAASIPAADPVPPTIPVGALLGICGTLSSRQSVGSSTGSSASSVRDPPSSRTSTGFGFDRSNE